ncbi:hypothetical protein [Bradyrhizobium sp. STM 3557]|uniref:hypothetical protein n=1 Tax=Bradyrhizobium sp. STM 3557 TaxID=578920 RepID=UPI00388E98CE
MQQVDLALAGRSADQPRPFPVGIRRVGNGFAVTLQDIAPTAFTDPFVAETIARLSRETYQRPLESFCDEASDLGAIAPRGIIYHVSKCGSTLVSQTLKQLDDVTVYSQPEALNGLLMPPHACNPDELVRSLRGFGALLAQHAAGPYVLKLESWHTLYCRELQRAFPTAPWVFCIRDPIDVAVSVIEDPDPGVWYRRLGHDANPFFDAFGLSQSAARMPGAYIALFYTRFCAAVRQLAPQTGRIVLYDSMPESIWMTVAPLFGLNVSAAELARMQRSTAYYSKAPHGTVSQFVADSADKRRRIAPDVRAAIEADARPAYEQMLEMMTDAG